MCNGVKLPLKVESFVVSKFIPEILEIVGLLLGGR